MKKALITLFTKNLLLKILGLFLGFFCWVALTNIQNPTVTRSLTVPITYDDSWLTENNYAVLSRPSSITISVSVRKNSASRIKSEDFTALVNMEEYIGGRINDAPSSTKFIVQLTKNSTATYIQDWDYPKSTGRYIEAVIDKVKTQSYRIGFEINGELANGYTIDQMTASPYMVKVKGATSDFSSLASVKAVVAAEEIQSDNISVTAVLHMYDGNNRIISNSTLTLSQDTVEVSIGLKETQTVGITVERYTGEPEAGYGCRSFDYEPKTIVVQGSRNLLEGLSTVKIPRTELDISGATEDMVISVDISKYLPDSVALGPDQTGIITISFDIEKLEERSFYINSDVFQLIGINDAYNYEIVSDKTAITLRSYASELDRFVETNGLSANISGTVNVSGLEAGDTTVFIPVIVSMENTYSLVGDIALEMKITLKEESRSQEPTEYSSTADSPQDETEETENQTVSDPENSTESSSEYETSALKEEEESLSEISSEEKERE